MPKNQQQQPDHLEEPQSITSESAVRNLVLRRLNQRSYTRKQLEDYLARKSADPQVVETVLNRFVEVHLIDDAEYAREYVRAKRAIKGAGPSVLRMELKKRGIDEALITDAIDGRLGEDVDVARTLAEKKRASLGRFDAATQSRRIASFLIRRGYSPQLAFSVTREVVTADPLAEEPWHS